MSRSLSALAPLVTLLGGCAALIDVDLRQAHDTGQPLYVGRITAAEPDQRDRIDVNATIFNTSAKTYRYVDLTVAAHRRPVGTASQSPPTSTATLRLAGPLRPRRSAGLTTWRHVWRGEAVACIELVRVALTDMDGHTVAVDAAALADVVSRRLRRGCPVT